MEPTGAPSEPRPLHRNASDPGSYSNDFKPKKHGIRYQILTQTVASVSSKLEGCLLCPRSIDRFIPYSQQHRGLQSVYRARAVSFIGGRCFGSPTQQYQAVPAAPVLSRPQPALVGWSRLRRMSTFPAASSASFLAALKRCASPVGTGSGTTSASTAGWRGNPPARSAVHLLPRVQAAPGT